MRWLLLRGLSREQRHWRTFPQLFEQRTSARVHCLDLPGMGTEHQRASPPTLAAITDDVRARWRALRAAHDEPWGVLAISLGGMVAMQWCAAHPGDFERLVLASTSAGDLSSPFERFSPSLVPGLLRALTTRDPVRREEHVLAMTTRMVRDRRAIAEEWARYQQDRPVARANVVRQLRAAAAFRVPERIDVPTLVLAGRGDRMVDASCARRVASRLGASLEIHPEAGHDLALDAPTWIADRVVAWMGGTTESPAGLVTQPISRDRSVRLRKQIVRIARPAGGALFATRKGPPRAPAATLVLIHGFAQNRYAFHLPGHSFTGWLADAGIDTWNVEMQGVGRSRAESPFARSLDELVDDSFVPAVRFIAREVGRPVFVLGHSLGGVLTFSGVPAARDAIAGAIAMAAIRRFTHVPRWWRWIGEGLTESVRSLDAPDHVPLRAGARVLASAPLLVDNALFRSVPVGAFYPGTFERSKLRWWLEHAFEPGVIGPVLQLGDAAARGSLISRDGSVDYGRRWESMRPLPVLGVAADRDPFVPVAAARESIERSPGSDTTFEVMTSAHGGSHWGHADLVHGRAAPEFVWTRVRDWILRRA